MSRPISRRTFLETANASILAGGFALATTQSTLGAAEGLYNGEIVDTHVHLWDLKKLNLPWVASATGKAKDVLAHDHLLSDYAKASEGLKITKAVYMEVDVAEADEVNEAEYVTKLCQAGDSPLQAAVISGRPASSDFAKYLDGFRGNPSIKGLRQVLHTPATTAKFCLEPAFIKGVQLLGERGLSFDLCLRNDQLEYGADLVDLCPGTRFILDHCGNPHAGSNDIDGWRKGLAKIAGAKNRNVMCKVSGIYGNVTIGEWPADRLKPIVQAVIDDFGLGSRDVRRRLAGREPRRVIESVGRDVEDDREGCRADPTDEALPRQRDPVLRPEMRAGNSVGQDSSCRFRFEILDGRDESCPTKIPRSHR